MSDYAEKISGDTIRIERNLPGPIERVWSYLVEPDLRAKWLAQGPLDPRAGGAFEFTWFNSKLSPSDEPVSDTVRAMEGHSMKGTVLACDPPNLLAFSWTGGERESEVKIELTPVQERIQLVLIHTRLASPLSVSAGWHMHLDILKDNLERVTPRPFWSNFTRLQAEYRKAS